MLQATVSCNFKGSKKEFANYLAQMQNDTKINSFNVTYDQNKNSSPKMQTALSSFKQKYSLEVSKYSERSLLLKTSKVVDDNDKVFKSDELNKPLYYNPSLKGWITSLTNAKYFDDKTVFKSITKSVSSPSKEYLALKDYVNKYQLKKSQNKTDRGYFLVSSTKKVSTDKDAKFTSSLLKHGLFYNKQSKVWVTSIDNKALLETVMSDLSNTVNDTSSYDDALSDMTSSTSDEYDATLSHLSFEEYGKGLLICPKKNDSNYGQKYFHGGYWNKTLQGWVFSKSKQSSLEEMGATYTN